MDINIDFRYPDFLIEPLFSEVKYVSIVAARRTGKTLNAIQWLIEECISIPNTRALHVDTTQKNIVRYYERYYSQMLKPFSKFYEWEKTRQVIRFLHNGSYIDFGSAERPENLEGFAYDRAILNEAGIILKRKSLWENTLLPMFKHPDCRVRLIGTPKGKGKFHELTTINGGEYRGYHFSAYDSPFWTKEEVEKVKVTMPEEVFRQEMLAEFIDGAGSVFRNIGQCVREPQAGLRADVMGVDLAKHQDFTVITLANQKHKQVISQDRFNQVDWTFQKNRIYNAWLQNGKPKVIIDSTGAGDPIFDDLKNAGMSIQGYKFTNTTKAELIQNLSVSMDNSEIFFPNIPNLIAELEVFGYDISPMGNIRYNAPEGLHDDAVISLALANYLIKTKVEVELFWL